MKKIALISTLLLSFAYSVQAQVNPHAIGFRGGLGNYGTGGEISYQHGFGEVNRLELDLGFRAYSTIGNKYRHFVLSGIYHWVWEIEDGLNWYLGPGVRLGFWSDDNGSEPSGITLGVGGQLGIEYDFQELGAPLLLGLDTRPMWGFIGNASGFGYGAAISLRYTF
jgi:hypothetical protein